MSPAQQRIPTGRLISCLWLAVVAARSEALRNVSVPVVLVSSAGRGMVSEVGPGLPLPTPQGFAYPHQAHVPVGQRAQLPSPCSAAIRGRSGSRRQPGELLIQV